jgi:hypothetical protein
MKTHDLIHKITNQIKALEKIEEPKDFLITTRIGHNQKKL